jgi:hypothetical protein
MGRKSREKRDRRAPRQPDEAIPSAVAIESGPPAEFDAPPIATPRRRRPKSGPVGARVARVAVDDATWAAFRELCGTMPASVRLGELVEADVRRARESTPESEALAAVRAVRAHADQLEAFVRARAVKTTVDG